MTSNRQILAVIRIEEYFEGMFAVLRSGNCANFSGNARSCSQSRVNFFDEWDVSLATNISSLLLIQDFFVMEFFLTRRDGGSCRNSVRSAALVKVCICF